MFVLLFDKKFKDLFGKTMLFGVTCSNCVNTEKRIFDYYVIFGKSFKFYKPFVNFILLSPDTIVCFRLV